MEPAHTCYRYPWRAIGIAGGLYEDLETRRPPICSIVIPEKLEAYLEVSLTTL